MSKRTNTKRQDGSNDRALGDAELILLSSGGARSDRLVEPPETMKPVTRQRAAGNLIKRGLAVERVAGRDEPAWREQDGERLALEVSAAGLAAIGIEDSAPSEQTRGDADRGRQEPAPDPAHPRPGSKGALVVSLLTRTEGASIEELIAETGWLPHTTRAALTGLRKRGFAIRRDSDEGGSRYRIPAPQPELPVRRGRRPRASEARAAA